MESKQRNFYFLVTVTLTSTVAASSCAYQWCNCDGDSIDCSYLGLRTIPALNNQGYGNFSRLSFDNNLIIEIPGGSLPQGLTELSFQLNPIATIDDTAFDGSANTLTLLSFSTAQFSKIPDAFQHLKSLTGLNIFQSQVLDWNVGVMRYLGATLHTLNLSNVTITTWPDWLKNYTKMTELSLVNCLLASIPDNAFDAMINSLTSVTLTGNLLTSVPKALYNLPALVNLYIDMNQIADTKGLPIASKLTGLSLNNNNIFNASQLSESLRPYTNSLTDFDIVSNKLSAIPQLEFLTITSLDLSYNLISDPRTGTLPSGIVELNIDHNLLPLIPSVVSSLKVLTDLGLENNVIREIRGTDIPVSVTYLNLGYNQITAVTDTSFPPNCGIQAVRLNNNPLATISGSAFNNLGQLTELYLDSTRITRLPSALSSLGPLNKFGVGGINGLVCTCQEKSLRNWVMSMSSGNVLGNCGVIGVYEFFATLSQGCPD